MEKARLAENSQVTLCRRQKGADEGTSLRITGEVTEQSTVTT